MLAREMRVVHIVPARFSITDGVLGGAERYAYELARNMAWKVPTRLVTFGATDHSEHHDELDVRIIGRPWYVRGERSNPFSPRLYSAIRDATVLHCHQQHVLASSLTAVYCRLTGRRVFVTDLGGGGWDISAYVSTDRLYHGHLHISAYSRYIFGQQNNPRARIIYGGVDTERFSPDPSVLRTGEVLFVGRLLPHKGVNDLIEAMPPGMLLTIVGQPVEPAYEQDLRRLATGKRVDFISDADDDALVAAYRRALCIVLPSVYNTAYGLVTKVPELLGQTLLEGMACSTPAVASDVASLPEVVDHGVTGFIVPPNNPQALRERLEWLATHTDDALRMGKAGRDRVLERFTWPRVIERCLKAYQGE